MIGLTVSAQTNSSNGGGEDKVIYTVVETPANFPGGVQALAKFIQDNIRYPDKMRELGVGGKVFMKFVINEDGSVNGVEVLKGTGAPELDREAIRVVESMPWWEPAKMSGRRVKCYFNLPIGFALSTPYLIFGGSSDPNYARAKTLILESGNLEEALNYYEKSPDDAFSVFNLGVIQWIKGNKRASKKSFEKVRDHFAEVKDTSNALYVLSSRFLSNNF
jgi:TonB family protein